MCTLVNIQNHMIVATWYYSLPHQEPQKIPPMSSTLTSYTIAIHHINDLYVDESKLPVAGRDKENGFVFVFKFTCCAQHRRPFNYVNETASTNHELMNTTLPPGDCNIACQRGAHGPTSIALIFLSLSISCMCATCAIQYAKC